MYFLVPHFIHMLLITRKPSSKKMSKCLATTAHGVESLKNLTTRNRTSGLTIQSLIFSGTFHGYIMACDLQENITNL